MKVTNKRQSGGQWLKTALYSRHVACCKREAAGWTDDW